MKEKLARPKLERVISPLHISERNGKFEAVLFPYTKKEYSEIKKKFGGKETRHYIKGAYWKVNKININELSVHSPFYKKKLRKVV